MNTFTAKPLADGQVANSLAAIFTATADVATYVKSFSLYNTSATEQTVIIKLNVNGTDRFWKRFVLAENEWANVLDGAESITLGDGDIIKAQSTTTNVVDYVITGVEETPP